ncbi:MAG TPA: universal stress protein [Methanomassiliicoccales archaeon]|nr:universal stress protein [Methanomassiliicoccales archaeon]
MNLYRTILIPTDGSSNSRSAIEHGLEIAKLSNAEVTTLSVIDVGDVSSTLQGMNPAPHGSVQAEVADAAVGEASAMAEKAGVKMKVEVRMGSPALDIIEMSGKFDLIVMGTQGRTGLPHLLIGSVAEKVVREAKCPVLVIKAKK